MPAHSAIMVFPEKESYVRAESQRLSQNRRRVRCGAQRRGAAFAAKSASKSSGRVIGANDRINIGVIGCGGRGDVRRRPVRRSSARRTTTPARSSPSATSTRSASAQAPSSTTSRASSTIASCCTQPDLDAVIVATPDHWHAKIALDAMDDGKDVYLEKPMVHTNEEARQLVNTVKETKRVLQVGSQTTSADIWWKAKKAIADGMIGKMIMSQGSYHRNSIEGEWNWPDRQGRRSRRQGRRLHRLEHVARLAVQARAQARRTTPTASSASASIGIIRGGIATDLFYHVVAPLNICWDEPQFPHEGHGDRRHLRLQGSSAKCPTRST